LERRKTLEAKKMALATILTALAVALSPIFFPVGPTKCFPWQHMINVLAGILLGPWYAVAVATIAGVLRNLTGMGTIFAFPGGIPGALIVGLVYKFLQKVAPRWSDLAAFTEPIGTGLIGAALSALIVAPLAFGHGVIKTVMPLTWFIIAFSVSSIAGTILGFLVLIGLRKSGVAPPE
jgi:energy-coupling factor transport system ATP-binding protein